MVASRPNPFIRPNRVIGHRKDGRPIYEIAGGDGTSNPVLERLYEKRDTQLAFVEELTEKADAEDRTFTESELANLNSAREIVEQLKPQIEQIEQFESLRKATEETTRKLSGSRGGDQRRGQGERRERRGSIRTEPREVYRSAGELIVDRIRAYDGDGQAEDRIRDAGLTRILGEARAAADGETTANTSGILPTPIVGTIVSDIDASRPLITSLGPRPMAGIPGTQFTRPSVTQHTLAGQQAVELDPLPTQQLVITGIPFTKKTYGGALKVSRQDVDWTQPAVWDAILRDMQDQYGVFSESAVATDFEAAPTNAAIAVASDDLAGWSAALYSAAGSVYAGVKRLPDMIWCSIDVWEKLGPITDVAILQQPGGTESSLSSFAGNLFKLPRVVVPEFGTGKLIIGYSGRYEVYEDRLGLLQQVQPSIVGIELAYAGFCAFKALNGAAFTPVTPPVAGV